MTATAGTAGRVLVTGASGLIGSHVVRALAEAGYEPRGFARSPVPEQIPAIEWIVGDVRDVDALRAASRGCAAVLHVAALYSFRRGDHDAMDAVNVEGTRNVLSAAHDCGVARVVVTSSCATCGPVQGRCADESDEPPASECSVPYKRTKLAAERIALQRAAEGQDVVVVNPTTTVGAGDRRPTPSGRIVRDVLAGRIRGYVRGGLNLVSATDVARGHVLALRHGRSGERYLLGGENLTMQRLFELVATLGDVPAPRIAVPYAVAFGAAEVLEATTRLVGREPALMTLDEVRLARSPMYFSSTRAERELGYVHAPASDALVPAVRWFGRMKPPRPDPPAWRWMWGRLRAGGGASMGTGSS